MINRIGTLQKNERSQYFIGQTQQRTFELQTQITSGKKSQSYTGISQDAATLVNLENIREKSARYVKNINQTQVRLNTMESYVGTLTDNMISMRSSVINGLNNENTNFMALGQEAESLLTHAANILNTRDGNSFLFAGSRTDLAPVDLDAFTGPPDPVISDDTYYQGDNYKRSVQVDKDFNLEYGVTANDPAFEKYIRGLRLIAENPFDTENLRGALGLLTESIDAANNLVSTIGADSAILEKTLDSHSDIKLNLDASIALIEDTDVVEATTRLSQEETILQASYLTISRLSRLSLVQYLN